MIHIVPINDLMEHEDSSVCPCCPSVEILENGDLMVIHNAYTSESSLIVRDFFPDSSSL